MPGPHAQHAGLDDWIEVFRAGTHTDSAGVTRAWSAEDLDQVVHNHQPGTEAPLVIGHPTTDAPAWGWTSALRRDGDSLQMRVRDVHPEFAESVREGRYRKRSVKLAKGPRGWELIHVGFLGAAAPALRLQPIAFRDPGGESASYEMDAYTPSVLSRVLRRLREWLIERESVEVADRVLPDFEIDGLAAQADAARADDGESPVPSFAAPSPGGTTVTTLTQADLDRAIAQAREQQQAEFAAREQALNAQLEAERRTRRVEALRAEARTLVDAGRLTPAQAQGLAEFMAALPGEDTEARIEFAAGDGTERQPPLAWLRAFLASLPARADLTRETDTVDPGAAGSAAFNAPQGAAVDTDRLALHHRALAWQAAHPNTDYLTAVRAVEHAGA